MKQEAHTGPQTPLVCPMCQQHHFIHDHIILSTEGLTFLKLEWADPIADTYTCTNCNHILWFMIEAIGHKGEPLTLLNQQVQCPRCQGTIFTERDALISATGTGHQQIDEILSPGAANFICTRCGFIRWLVDPPKQDEDRPYTASGLSVTCTNCGQHRFLRREALLDTVDKANHAHPSAETFTCTTCGCIEWFKQDRENLSQS